MNAIDIQGLYKSYRRGQIALDALDLTVPRGCVFGLLGPNGAGKSTTINILAGIVHRDGGEVRILGTPVRNRDYAYKQHVGFVLERPHYIEKLTAEEYLGFAAVLFGIEPAEAGRRIAELIAFFGLDEQRDAWIETYSTGMKKKVSLAAALIHRPQLLVLDEPLEGIDPVSAGQVKENLRLMAGQGATVLLSSHVLETVEKLCDEVAIINRGRRVLQCRTHALGDGANERARSLEEMFTAVVSGDRAQDAPRRLSWL